MKTKQTLSTTAFVITSLMMALVLTPPMSYAQSPTRGILRELRKEVVQEKKEQVRENTKNILEQVKNIIKEKIKKQLKGVLVSISGNVLTVKKDENSYTVNVTSKTELKRKFGAASSLDEFNPNDQLLIIGNRKKNSDGTLSTSEIDASYIRNMSIQRRFAVFNGKVLSISTNSFVIQTKSRGTQTVYTSTQTQYKEKNAAITFADIHIGDNLIVKGELWDRVNEKIDAKTVLKLANPVKPTQAVQVKD